MAQGINDTHPEIERRLFEAYRAMPPAEKLMRVFELNQRMDILIEASVRQRYPNASEREVRLRVASRRVPADLMRRALDWDPEAMGY